MQQPHLMPLAQLSPLMHCLAIVGRLEAYISWLRQAAWLLKVYQIFLATFGHFLGSEC
jgi:hypothetical protein